MNDSPRQDAPGRLAAYRAAREAGDAGAIRAASRAALAAVEADALAQALAHLRSFYEGLPEDPTPEAIERAEADAWARMDRKARAAIRDDTAPAAAP